MKKNILSLTLLTWCFPLFSQVTTPLSQGEGSGVRLSGVNLYTLDQLKQLAVENNYNLRSARNAIQQSKELQSEAYTKYFPSLSASGVAVTFDKPNVGNRS